MDMSDISKRGLCLLGCGKMGSALLAGWLGKGVPASAVWVSDPAPSDWLRETGVHLNEDMPKSPAIVVVAVKPQMMDAALPSMAEMAGGATVFLSIAAGKTIATFEAILGAETPIVRSMPNTPAAIGQGITAIVGNAVASAQDLDLAEALLASVGRVVRLTDEAQMDAVTAVSGSGPAYVFHMIEAMAAAGEAMGLQAALAYDLALETVAGAGALAAKRDDSAAQLRINVTSPAGTTAAALDVLMDEANGLPPLLARAMQAAKTRSEELS